MNNPIELDILVVDYSKIKKIVSKIESLKSKLSYAFYNESSIKSKIEEKIHDLSIEIENSPKIRKKFKFAIMMGNLLSTSTNICEYKIVYDLNGFSTHPNTFGIINNDKFITDIYSQTSFVFIDEENKVWKLKKYFNNFTISLTDNDCVFISNEQIEILKNKMLHLLNSLCSKSSKITRDDKIKFGIYLEKLNSLFNSIHSFCGYDLSEYYIAGLGILNFNELVSKIVIKLFNGEKLKDFEKIVIAKLTNSQMLEILNNYIQHNYRDTKLHNYLTNIGDINNIIGCINFKQYIKSKESKPISVDTNNYSNSNIIEVDFIKRKVKK